MSPILRRVFAIMTALANLLCSVGGQRTEPVFSDLPMPTKAAIETERFSMGKYDLIVSPDGDDIAEGTLDAPLRTIEEAKARLAKLDDRTERVHVWLRSGNYVLSETIVFDANDRPNVTYIAYPGEQISLNGGKAIRGGWTETTVNGVRAWKQTVEGSFHSLYGEQTGTVRPTRYPESGYFRIREQCTEGAAYTPETTPWQNYMLGEVGFYADKDDLRDFPTFRNPTSIVTRVLHYWKDEMLPVQSYDAERGLLTHAKYSSMSPKKGDRYYFENVFEALNEPGEWYLDSTDNTLYYVPLPGETPDNTTLYAASLEQFVTMDGVDGITFEGITFRNSDYHVLNTSDLPSAAQDSLLGFHYGIEHPQAAFSTPASIHISNASHITFDACNFLNIGFSGIRFSENVHDSTVTRCLFRNIGGNAVYISGTSDTDKPDEVTSNVAVTDCHIYGYGRRWFNAIGVLATHARQCRIEHNEIHDGYYTAISVGWTWGYAPNVTDENRICDNRIYDIGQGWLSDMGGIYTLGMQPHTVISGNRIYNVAADEGQGGYGGWGIYLDEGSSGILVEKNLVYDCGSQGFHQHYGKENRIRNNIFAMNRKGQFRITRSEAHLSAYVERNIFVGDDSAMMTGINPKNRKIAESGNFYRDYARGVFVLSTQTGDDKTRNPFKTLNRLQMRLIGNYTDAEFADPWFRDAKGFDFTLADNSPAVQAGFERWNYNEAGTLSYFDVQ